MAAETYVLALPGPMLRRGFWLYVLRVDTPKGEMLYVGRTGDNSSPNAVAPFTRMGQHLWFSPTQNALRKHLKSRGIDAENCDAFQLISYGPIEDEVVGDADKDRDALMVLHKPRRDRVGALEKKLAEALKAAKYDVLNTVKWKHEPDAHAWAMAQKAFAPYFPRLEAVTGGQDNA